MVANHAIRKIWVKIVPDMIVFRAGNVHGNRRVAHQKPHQHHLIARVILVHLARVLRLRVRVLRHQVLRLRVLLARVLPVPVRAGYHQIVHWIVMVAILVNNGIQISVMKMLIIK